MAAEEKECTLVGGIHVAGAVAKAQLSRLGAKNRSEEQRQSSETAENFLKSIMERYYTPFVEDVANCPFHNDSWTKGLGALLCKVGRLIASEKGIDEATQQKFESKLRDTLEKNSTAPLPDRVLAVSQEDVVVSAHPDATLGNTLVATDASGVPVLGVKRLAAEAGFEPKSEVIWKSARGTECPDVGVVRSIEDGGVMVSWAGSEPKIVDVADLAPAPKRAKKDQPEDPILTGGGVKWSQCSSAENTSMLMQMAHTTLYQLYVGQSAAHADLVLMQTPSELASSQGPVSVYTRIAFKQGGLVLLPFHSSLVEAACPRPSHAAPLRVTIVRGKDEPVVADFWIKSKATPKKLIVGCEKAVVMVPFWVLASTPLRAPPAEAEASSQGGQTRPCVALDYKTVSIEVPSPSVASAAGGKPKGKIIVGVQCMTNPEPLAAGSRIFVSRRPPDELD